MKELTTVDRRNTTNVKVGDQFTFVAYVDGKPTRLTGSVEVMMPSDKARTLGLTKSSRKRLFLLLRVPGHEGPINGLFPKDRGQVKPVK